MNWFWRKKDPFEENTPTIRVEVAWNGKVYSRCMSLPWQPIKRQEIPSFAKFVAEHLLVKMEEERAPTQHPAP